MRDRRAPERGRRAADRGGQPAADARGDPPSRAGSARDPSRRRRRARKRAAQHRRRRRRPPADPERGRVALDRLQRRDLQPPRAAGRTREERTPVPDAERHRGPPPPVRGSRVRVSRAPQRTVRGGDLGPEIRVALPRAGPPRDPAALLRAVGRRVRLRLRDQGAPRGAPIHGPDRSARAGRDIHLLEHAPRPERLRGHRGAAARPHSDREPQGQRARLLVAPDVRARPAAPRRRRRRGAPRVARGRDADPAAGRRAGRRLPERRTRLLGHRRDRAAPRPGPARDLLDRLPGRRFRRAGAPGPDGPRARDPPPRPRGDPRGHRPRLPRRRVAHGDARSPHGAGPDVPALEARARLRLQGRPHGRGRGRAPRRIRHLQGDDDPAILGAAARLAVAPAAPQAALPRHSGARPRPRLLSARVLRRRAHRHGLARLFARGPMEEHRADQAVLLGGAPRRTSRGALPRPPGSRSRRTSRAGTRFRRPSTSRRACSCPSISSRRRATGSPWPIPSKGATRSSTSASSTFCAGAPLRPASSGSSARRRSCERP